MQRAKPSLWTSSLWTLADAQELASVLEPLVRPLGYHTLLGGGVVHKGYSSKDCDVWFLPLEGHESHPCDVYAVIADVLGSGKALRDGPDYGPGMGPMHAKEAQLFTFNGKRVDVFIF